MFTINLNSVAIKWWLNYFHLLSNYPDYSHPTCYWVLNSRNHKISSTNPHLRFHYPISLFQTKHFQILSTIGCRRLNRTHSDYLLSNDRHVYFFFLPEYCFEKRKGQTSPRVACIHWWLFKHAKFRVYQKHGIRIPESGIRKNNNNRKKWKFVDMKISTKVKVTWETVFIAIEKL